VAQIELVHKGAKTPASPNIVFVHGLGGDIRKTWMHDPNDDLSLWPRWVAEDADCDVLTVGYDAEISGWRGSAMEIPDQGVALLNALQVTKELRGRPLILVGHSMGGLVIKEAVVQASTLGDLRLERVLEDLAAIAFVATPHQGAHLAKFASALGYLLRANPQVENLHANDVHLKKLNTQFRKIVESEKISIRSFYETHPISIKRKYFIFNNTIIVVDRNSSDPSIPNEEPVPIPGNHFSIAKPASRQADIHRSLVSFIEEIQKKNMMTYRRNSFRPPMT
jgi:pimeloyl-ACP methyl ester carboxylesterase